MGYDNTAVAELPAIVGRAWRNVVTWAIAARLIAQYFVYRAGMCAAPRLTEHWPPVQRFFRQVTRMDGRTVVRGAGHCPAGHPAVFACNHVKLDDPFFVCYAAQAASDLRIHTRFVMRDDYFDGPPWNRIPFIDVNEIAQLGGGYLVSLDRIQLSQLRPIVEVLLEPFSFAIFPGRTRSRSGLIMDWREGYTEPAAVSFFVGQAQRKCPGRPVPVVPLARTHNPATGVSTLVMGEPLRLPADADRAAQRAFDLEIVERIGALVEVHLLHLICVLVYLRALHGRPASLPRHRLAGALHRIVDAIGDLHRDPAMDRDFAPSMDTALGYLERQRFVRCDGAALHFDHAAILALPPLDTRFRARNPVRFLCNQVLHFDALVRAAETEALRP